MQIRNALALALVVALFAYPVAASAQGRGTSMGDANFGETQMEIPDIGIDQKVGETIPLDLEFIDETGRTVQLGDYFDGRRPVVLSLVYFDCPMLCGEVLNGKVEALKNMNLMLGDDFQAVTVSFDPGEDATMAAAKKEVFLQEYGKPGGQQGWHWLTGEKDNIDALCEATGFSYYYDPDIDQFAHAGAIMVLTPDGAISRYFFGIEYPAKDVRLALLEASKNQIGSAVEQLLLLCYQYDPTTGTYNLMVFRLLQVGGLATVLTMAFVVFLLFRFEKRKARREAARGEQGGGQGSLEEGA